MCCGCRCRCLVKSRLDMLISLDSFFPLFILSFFLHPLYLLFVLRIARQDVAKKVFASQVFIHTPISCILIQVLNICCPLLSQCITHWSIPFFSPLQERGLSPTHVSSSINPSLLCIPYRVASVLLLFSFDNRRLYEHIPT